MNNNYLKVKIVGKNINNYIKWLIKQKINIYELDIKNYQELIVKVDYKNYKLLKSFSKTYKIIVLKKYGTIKIKNIINKNKFIIMGIIASLVIIYTLSNVIFKVEIVYNDKEIIKIINKELKQYNIKKFHFKKTQSTLQKIKEKILNNNKDILEWLEIEESGTKYIIKLVERKKALPIKENVYQNIVSSKNAIITSIKASSGEKTKTINEYVNKDETVISGIMTKPDGTNIYTKANGKIYGEVWYKITIEYPFYYQEEKVTGKNKFVLFIYFFNRKIPIYPYKKYKQFKTEGKSIIENSYLPLKIVKEKLYEVNIKEEIYTEEKVISKAVELSNQKLKESNSNIIKINKTSIINESNLNSKIKLDLFISAIEDITKIVEINPESEEKINS